MSGGGIFDPVRSYKYDADENRLEWVLKRIETGDIVQWSEFGGSWYEG